MSEDAVSFRREWLSLVADGCVVSSGVFALLMGCAFILEWLGVAPLGEPGGTGADLVLSTISWLLQVGGLFVGPLLAWRLSGRRFTKIAVLGLAAGFPLGGALVLPVAMLGSLFDLVVGWFVKKPQYAGAIAYLVILVSALAAVIVWRVVASVRDLAASRREHVPLDVTRLVGALAVLVFGAVVGVMTLQGQDAVEAFAFVLLAAVEGAGVVAVASLITRFVEQRSASAPAAPSV